MNPGYLFALIFSIFYSLNTAHAASSIGSSPDATEVLNIMAECSFEFEAITRDGKRIASAFHNINEDNETYVFDLLAPPDGNSPKIVGQIVVTKSKIQAGAEGSSPRRYAYHCQTNL